MRVHRATPDHPTLYALCSAPYTASVLFVQPKRGFFAAFGTVLGFCALISSTSGALTAQNAAQQPAEKSSPKAVGGSQEKPIAKTPSKPPAQIELLETHVRFEANGDSRKEVHALVKINDEAGARQFARLSFNYNRSFQSIEIPLARITHANGGTSDVLPSAITDNPDPAVVNFPAYQDVRVKSIRILGLEPGDVLEYRVVTTVTDPPLAPNFWLEHTFDHSGVVSNETFQVALPASAVARVPIIIVKNEGVKKALEARLYPNPGCGLCVQPDLKAPIDPKSLPLWDAKQEKPAASKPTASATPASATLEPLPPLENGKIQLLLKPSVSRVSVEKVGDSSKAEVLFTWHLTADMWAASSGKEATALEDVPDIQIGRNSQWPDLSYQLFKAFSLPAQLPDEVVKLSQQLTASAAKPMAKAEKIYDFVSQRIKTVDLALGSTGFHLRPLAEIISSGYATQEDKFFLFEALAKAGDLDAQAALVGPAKRIAALMAAPSAFAHLLVDNSACNCWMDPALEVAPFGAIPAPYRGAAALVLDVDNGPIADAPASSMIVQIFSGLPYPSKQNVTIDATLGPQGTLTARAKYAMRGDNELLLRVAFHQSPPEKWDGVAQLLALSDGFRGQVTKANASDPYETHDPFTVEYEITQPKFVDWSKKLVRIPALLPLLGLPDPPEQPVRGVPPAAIELGPPLDVEVSSAMHLPDGAIAHVPAGTSVSRDFATYSSKYSVSGTTLTASRHINFILKEIPADRAAEYVAFLRAVQNDESQVFTLQRADTAPTGPPKP